MNKQTNERCTLCNRTLLTKKMLIKKIVDGDCGPPKGEICVPLTQVTEPLVDRVMINYIQKN